MRNQIFPNILQAFVLIGCLIAAFGLYFWITYSLTAEKSSSSVYLPIVFFISSFIYIPFIVFAVRKGKINVKEYLKVPDLRSFLFLVVIATSAFLLSVLFIVPLGDFKSLLNGHVKMIRFELVDFNLPILIRIIHVVILAPFLEEFFYRKIILSQFLKQYSPSVAIVISALLFAVCHLQLEASFSLFMHGIVFGIVYYRTGLLLASILVHALINMLSYCFFIYQVNVLDSRMVHVLVIGFLSAFFLYQAIKRLGVNNGKISSPVDGS